MNGNNPFFQQQQQQHSMSFVGMQTLPLQTPPPPQQAQQQPFMHPQQMQPSLSGFPGGGVINPGNMSSIHSIPVVNPQQQQQQQQQVNPFISQQFQQQPQHTAPPGSTVIQTQQVMMASSEYRRQQSTMPQASFVPMEQQPQHQYYQHQQYASTAAINAAGGIQQQQYYEQQAQQQFSTNAAAATANLNPLAVAAAKQQHSLSTTMSLNPASGGYENYNPNIIPWNSNQPQPFKPPQTYQQPPAPARPTYEVYEPSSDVVVPYQRQPSLASVPAAQPAYQSSGTTTNILSSNDGTMMMQEVFLGAGQQVSLTDHSTVNFIDLQGIWTCVRRGSGGGNAKSDAADSIKLLSVRMVNNGTGTVMADMRLQFQPNCFGLTIDPSISVLPNPQGLTPGQRHNVNLTLYSSADNQITPPPLSPQQQDDHNDQDISHLTLCVEYRLSSNPSKWHRFSVNTFVPLHLFFQAHEGAPTDDGPRVGQTVFLSLWQNDYQTSSVAHSQSFCLSQPVPTLRWYQQFIPTGILKSIVDSGGICNTQDPSLREIIAIIEHKLSMNRIYTVAARETMDNGKKSLVFFCSLRVGGLGAGSLVLGEFRLSGDGFADCSVQLRSKISRKFRRSIERAIQSILLS